MRNNSIGPTGAKSLADALASGRSVLTIIECAFRARTREMRLSPCTHAFSTLAQSHKYHRLCPMCRSPRDMAIRGQSGCLPFGGDIPDTSPKSTFQTHALGAPDAPGSTIQNTPSRHTLYHPFQTHPLPDAPPSRHPSSKHLSRHPDQATSWPPPKHSLRYNELDDPAKRALRAAAERRTTPLKLTV